MLTPLQSPRVPVLPICPVTPSPASGAASSWALQPRGAGLLWEVEQGLGGQQEAKNRRSPGLLWEGAGLQCLPHLCESPGVDISLLGLPQPCLCVHVSLLLSLSFCFSLTLSSTLWGSSFQLWEVKDQPIRQLACLYDTGHLGLGLAGGGWSFALASRWPATCSLRILVPFAQPPQYVSLSFLTVFSLDYFTPGVPATDRMPCVCVCVCARVCVYVCVCARVCMCRESGE